VEKEQKTQVIFIIIKKKKIFKIFVLKKGGPYNDCLSDIANELSNELLGIFIPCLNRKNEIGENRECLVPNPLRNSKSDLQLYEFVGRLMVKF
jgi:hypothetical protein